MKKNNPDNPVNPVKINEVSYKVSETEAGSQRPDTGRNELEIPRSRGCHFGFWIQELS
jgi:hypothetical protein